MAKNTKLKTILVKNESSYNASTTPSGSANAVKVTSLELTPIVSDEVSREVIREYHGNQQVLLANQRVEVSVTVEMTGSGTAGTAPKYSPLLESSGLALTTVSSTSNTYAPESSGFGSCTIWCNYDGVLHKITGARGSFSINLAVSEIPTITFNMVGIKSTITDTALPTTTFSLQADPVIVNSTNTDNFSIFGYSGILQNWSFDMNNSVIYRELVGGSKSVLITDRTPSGSLTVEMPALSAHNFFTDAEGSSTGTNTWRHNGGAGNIVTCSCPQTDFSAPNYSDSDGIIMLDIPFMATPSAANNEFSLAFT